jgi:WD40 repeat protein
MGDPAKDDFDDLIRFEAAVDWQTRLTAVFFDAEANRKVIDEIRAAIAEQRHAEDVAKLESLRRRVVGHLVSLASRDAIAPDRGAPARPAPIAGAELEDRVVTSYPYPIVTPYRAFTDEVSAAGAFGCLLDTFEGLIHFLATVAVSAYLRGGLANPECNRQLLGRLVKDAWATGDLMALLSDTLKVAGDCEGRLPYRELPGYLFDGRNRPTSSLLVLESFVSLRNRVWGHGAGRDEGFFASILAPNRERLERELAEIPWLASWELIRPLSIDESGRLVKADLLMGERRLKDRPYDLSLESSDLDHQGGDVRPETSLLLVSPGRDAYLPLFPLSLFHFHLRSQGVYFLQRPQWQKNSGRRRLRRAGYVAYESGLEIYESGPGEPAALSIERHVGRLEANLGESLTGIVPEESFPAGEDPDCELPEVRQEQEFHLRTFAGREALLGRIAGWIEGKVEGGYLLLLGPPGQGKSALLAELARRRGCLLHMVKSHRNPLKFLPSLIGQAARLARVRFGVDAYRGDVDDLRNAFLRGLEAVRDRMGTAVAIIDALDELEGVDERLRFLPESLPAGVSIVLSCRPDIPLVHSLRSRLRDVEELSLMPLSGDDLPAVLGRRLGQEEMAALEGRVDWDGLFLRLQGNPLFLNRAVDRIQRLVAYEKAGGPSNSVDVGSFPASLESLFHDIYGEIAEKRGTRFTSPEGRLKARLLQFLCLAREPLGFESLGGLSAVAGFPLSLEECRDRVLEMSHYLLETATGFKPWHQGLVDYVKAVVLGEDGCRRVGETFCDWLGAPKGGAGHYGLRHRARHLAEARRFGELEALLSDPAFLEARTESGMVFELAADYSSALLSLPPDRPTSRLLALLEQAIRTDIHFIARHPSTLFQCLWNRGWWYDCPEAARHYMWPPGLAAGVAPWEQPGPRFHEWLETWRARKEATSPGFLWVRSHRPPMDPLGTTQRAIFRGHRSAVSCIACTPDGRRIATGSYDSSIRLWDVEGGAELACLDLRGSLIEGVAFSVDGRRLVVGSEDGIVWVWNVESGAELAHLPGHEGAVKGVAIAPDGTRFASGSTDGTFSIRASKGFVELARFRGPQGAVLAISFAPEGRRIACASADGTARVWDAATGVELARLCGHEDAVTSIAFTPDGESLVTGSRDRTVRVWDAATGAERACLRGHEYSVSGVAVSPDGQRIASGSADLTIRIWDLATGTELSCLRGHRYSILGVAFLPDGRRVASTSGDGSARIWDVDSLVSSMRLRGHDCWVTDVAVTTRGDRVMTTSGDGTVHYWDRESGLCLDDSGDGDGTDGLPSRSVATPWRASVRRGEIVFEATSTGEAVAWYPSGSSHLVPLSDGRSWAGATYHSVHILSLEGRDQETEGRRPPGRT